MASQVLVVGSLNSDLIMTVDRLPHEGETVRGTGLIRAAGGKGGNQAVAAGRLGVPTGFIGAVGEDEFGAQLVEGLAASGVDTADVMRLPAPTGLAMILVDPAGRNHIAVHAGANGEVTPGHLEARRHRFAQAKVCLLQLEIPLETVVRAARLAREAGALVVLDPAPAMDLPPELYGYVDLITPNETETASLTGIQVDGWESARRAAARLVEMGAKGAIIKRGGAGALVYDGETATPVPAIPVEAVDTVAAGDAFNGGLAAALFRGSGLVPAARYASAVAALSVTRRGAQPSLPWAREVDGFLRRHPGAGSLGSGDGPR